MYCIRYVVLLACLTLAALHATASAQSSKGGEPPGYNQAIDSALQEFDAGNFAEARTQFLKAHGIFPNARTLRALGKAEYELKNYREAAEYLQQALDSKVRPLTTEQRIETQRLLDSSRGYLGRYYVTVRPGSAKLMLDGTTIRLGENGLLVLKVGDHVLEAEADGYQPERRQLRVIGGGSETLAIDMKPLVLEPPAAALPEVALDESGASAAAGPMQSDSSPRQRRWWIWTGVAGVVAGGVVAAVLLSMREPKRRHGSGGTVDLDIPVSSRAGAR